MKHKLIIIDGHSTVGKSSLSRAVYKTLYQHRDIMWLHEECEGHPIRSQEFCSGDLYTREGMERNLRTMLAQWNKFAADIKQQKQACVVAEGCLLHQLDRYLLRSAWSFGEIQSYFEKVLMILEPLNPLIVFLHRPDLRNSFIKAYADRGAWWKQLILTKPDPVGYFQSNEYTGDESIYRSLMYEQERMLLVFNSFSCKKLMIDTSEEKWIEYQNKILEYLGIQSKSDEWQRSSMNRQSESIRESIRRHGAER